MVRPERFELPTFWFVEVRPREINNLHGMARSGQLRPNSPGVKMFSRLVAAGGLSMPSPARQDFGHEKQSSDEQGETE